MKLELEILKRNPKRTSRSTQENAFIVVDFDKAKEYPQNYVCQLPKTIERTGSSKRFVEIFGEKSRQTAINLLSDALERETDFQIKEEIEKRLKVLQPKPTIKAICVICGSVFEPRRYGRFLTVTCQKCRNK